MKSTMNMIRSATTAVVKRTQTSMPLSQCRPPGNNVCRATTRRLSKGKKLATGGLLLAAPSFLLTPTDSMIYDDDTDTTQTTNLSAKAPLTSSTLLTSPDSLKDSFDAFLHSIEPLIHRRMSVGVASIPHPAKIAKGGEDAYFLSTDMKVMGVADGMFSHFHFTHTNPFCRTSAINPFLTVHFQVLVDGVILV